MAISKRRKRKYLPSEVVTDIFARLPLESIGNVMLVNKFCLRLITSRDFAKAHLKYSQQGKTTNLSDYRCIFGISSDSQLLYQFSFASLSSNSNSSSVNVVDLDYPKKRLRHPDACLMGSCNGLLCVLLKKKYFFLWNPCTGKYQTLPRLDLHLDYKTRSISIAYGFAYDESTDDYKVVALCLSSRKNNTEIWTGFRYEIYVYSLKRNSYKWKRILQDLKGQVYSGFSGGKFVSGKVHWLSDIYYKDFTRRIVSFDVESEVFGIVEQPSYQVGYNLGTKLDTSEGCLCMLIHDDIDINVDLWIMKEYGIKESWTKFFTISCLTIPDYFKCAANMLPNGEVLFCCESTFVVYNPREDSFRFLNIRRPPSSNGCKPVFYVPSLVSPIV